MKKLLILFISIATIFSFTQCSNTSADKIVSDANTRAKVISELMNNDAYMMQVMDSMKARHADAIVHSSHDLMKSDKSMGNDMMKNMMSMCKDDSSMCKMMMGGTMEMCDADDGKCKMMMGCMQEHPKGMEKMKNMGMCNMKGTETDHKH